MAANSAPRPSGRTLIALGRTSTLLALMFSSIAAVDYYGRGHSFCAPGSGCDLVRYSVIGRSIGIALPALGLVGFASALLTSLSPRARLRRLALVFMLTGGV